MQPDQDFYKFLGEFDDGDKRQITYNNYKNNSDDYAYKLNAKLNDGGGLSKELMEMRNNLFNIIRAKNDELIELYRMTSVKNFKPARENYDLNYKFRYPSFLSLTRSKDSLRLIPPIYKYVPVILQVSCPSNTAMALMEGTPYPTSSGEAEILLPAKTMLTITDKSIIKDKEIRPYIANHYIHHGNINEAYLYKITVIKTPYCLNKTQEKFFYFKL